MAGAMAAGPVLAGLGRRFPRVSTRAIVAAIVALLAVYCLVPEATGSPLALWALIALYSPLTGVLWPIVEAYVSGGRFHVGRAVGAFNVTWAGTLAAGYWAMGPLLEDKPLRVVTACAVVHFVSLFVLAGFQPNPAAHGQPEEPGSDLRIRQHLPAMRGLLVSSYVLFSALTPILPTAFGRMGVSIGWAAPLAATWMIARVLTFAALGHWHGWRGSLATPWSGAVLLVAGFAATVLAPGAGALALAIGIVGLAAFGVGMGIIYTAALTYGMEAGKAEVGAGGVHETLIGAGYTAGPLAALLAAGLVRADALPPHSMEPVMLATAAVLAGALGGLGYALARPR
jgi:hypothetical protein